MTKSTKQASKKRLKQFAAAFVTAVTMTSLAVMPTNVPLARAEAANPDETRNVATDSWRTYDEFQSDYLTREEARKAALDTNREIMEEGAVLLKNDGALPLKKDANVTILGKNSLNIVYQGSGSSGNAGSSVVNLYDAFGMSDMETNPVAKAFYENNALSGIGRPGIPTFGNIPSGQPIGETRAVGALDYGGTAYNMKEVDAENKNFDPSAKSSNYDQAVPGEFTYSNGTNAKNPKLSDSFSAYNDAAVVVFSRIGGEGYDLPRTMVMNPTVTGSGSRVQYPGGNNNGNYANRPQNLSEQGFQDALMVPGARAKDSHYMQLDQNELNLLKEAAANFNNVIVVLNSASAIELDFLTDYEWSNKIKGCLWIATPGENGLSALPRILDGTVNPSGSLVDTYYADFLSSPVMQNFSNNAVQDGNRMQNPDGSNTPLYFVDYQEDIYLGYRYYETKYAEMVAAEGKEEADKWYKENVYYPFGHGLSYTTFTSEVVSWKLDDAAKADGDSLTLKGNSVIEVEVKVTNTGKVAGKKAVQIYAEAPYTAGGIEKASKVLVGYDKTDLIAPGASDTVKISCPVYYFASWDGTDANDDEHIGYEIEKGDYKLHVATDAHNTSVEIPFKVGTQLNIDKDPSSGNDIGAIFPEMTEHMNTKYTEDNHAGSARLSRKDNFANIGDVTKGNTRRVRTAEEISKYVYQINFNQQTPGADASEEDIAAIKAANAEKAAALFETLYNYSKFEKITTPYSIQHPAESMTYEEVMADGIAYFEMYGVAYDDPKWDTFMSQLTWQEMAWLVGGSNERNTNQNNIRFSSITLPQIGKPVAIHNDGPLGWSTKTNQGQMAYVEGTLETSGNNAGRRYIFPTDNEHAPIALVSTCVVAATMDQDFQNKVGKMLGEDALWGFENINSMTNSGGYAPGANTHRTPFSGRNFEYFSEDGVLGGITAGQIMVGQQEYGNFAFIKHFFMNDQETNRDGNMLATWSTEQTMREIYGRSFEIAIKMAIDYNDKLVGVMTAFARNGYVYCGSSSQLLNELLRGEWGFRGDVITDWTGGATGPMNGASVIIGGGSKELGNAPLEINDEMLNEPTYGNTYKWNIMRAAKDVLFSDVNSNNIVVAKSVRTIQVNLNDKKYIKPAEGETESVGLTFKVGEPVKVDLKTALVDAAQPDVWYGDKDAAQYTYFMANGYTLPKGLAISSDGILYGVPQETTTTNDLWHVFIKATGTYQGEAVEYYAGNQVLKMRIDDANGIAKAPVSIKQSGNVAKVESGDVNVKLTLSGSASKVIFRADNLPEGFMISADGVISGKVAEDAQMTVCEFKVYVDAYDNNLNYIGTSEKTLTMTLGKTNGVKDFISEKVEGGTKYTFTLDDGLTHEIIVPDSPNGVKDFTSAKVEGGTKYTFTLDDGSTHEVVVPDSPNGVKGFTSQKVEGGTEYTFTFDDGTTAKVVVPDAAEAPEVPGNGGVMAIGIVALILALGAIGAAVAFFLLGKKKNN